MLHYYDIPSEVLCQLQSDTVLKMNVYDSLPGKTPCLTGFFFFANVMRGRVLSLHNMH